MTKSEKMERFHRDNIANVAEQLFSVQGIEKTSMDQIAKEADYSKSTIYVYFKNKDEIILYLVLRGLKEINIHVGNIMKTEKTEIEKYNQICKILSNIYEKSPFIFSRIMGNIEVDEEKRASMPILEEIYQEGEDITQKIANLLQSGENKKVFTSQRDYSQVGFILWMMLAGVIMLSDKKEKYIETRFKKDKNSFLDDSFQLLLNLVK